MASITKSVIELVRVFINVTADVPSHTIDNVSNDYQFLLLDTLLHKVSSKLVSEFLQSLCKTNFGFVCFIARSTVEHCKASPAIADVSAHSILSAVAVALRQIFQLDDNTRLQLGSTIMKGRAFVSQPGSPFTMVSGDMLPRFTSAAALPPLQCDVRHVIKNIRALIVAVASNRQPILKLTLLFELQQAVYMHGDVIQCAFSLEQEVADLLWDVTSASASFVKLSAEQLFQAFASIIEDMKTSFKRYDMDVPRCTDVVSSALTCTLVVALLKSKDGSSQLSGAFVAQLFQSIPDFSKWFSLCITQFTISKYLETVPLSLTHSHLTYVRCSCPSAAAPAGSIAKVVESNSDRNTTSKSHQLAHVKFEERLWLAVSRQQPVFADSITLDLLEKRSVDVECPSSLERSINESLARLHVTASQTAEQGVGQQQSASAGAGTVSLAAVDDAQNKSCENASSPVAPVIGQACSVCSAKCGTTFYWAHDSCSASDAALKSSYLCLRCVFEEFVPKDALCHMRVSSIFSVPFTQPIFQMSLQRALSALKLCRIVSRDGFGSASVIAAADATDDLLPPPLAPAVMPFVSKFHANNPAITMSNAQKTACRPGSSGCFPIVSALPVANECSFQVIIDSDNHPQNSISFGIGPKSLKLSDTSGLGPTSGTWGVICSFGVSPLITKFVASGAEQGHFRALKKGDRLKGVANFEQKRFVFYLNDTEVTHTFTFDANLKQDNCVFALTLASSAQVTVVDQPHVVIKPIDSREQDPLSCVDAGYVWMQSITQEVMHAMRRSACDVTNLVSWFDEATSAVTTLLGDTSNSDPRVISPFRFAVARNALLMSTSDPSARAAVAQQLIPSALSMCEDAVSSIASGSSSACLMHFLTCDLAAATVPVAEIRTATAGCIQNFTQGNFARTLKLYAGLHVSSNLLWVHMLKTKPREDEAAASSCISVHKEHADFIRDVVCSELFALLPAVSDVEMMEALGTCQDRVTALLPNLFTDRADIRRQMAAWVARVIRCDSRPVVRNSFRNFILTLSCLTAVPRGTITDLLDTQPPSLPCVHMSGATGSSEKLVNGTFDEVEEMSCGQPVYVKRNDPDTCIHYWKATGAWILAKMENMGKSNGGAWAYVMHTGSLESASSLTTWKILSNGSFQHQPSVRMHFESALKPANADANTLVCSLHQHPLEKRKSVYNGRYNCDVCKRYGSGDVFHCQLCSWDAHPSCAAQNCVSTPDATRPSESRGASAAQNVKSSAGSSDGAIKQSAGDGVQQTPVSGSANEASLKSSGSEGQCSSDSDAVLVSDGQSDDSDTSENLELALVVAGGGNASCMTFLQDLHAACFLQAHSDDAFTVQAWLSASKAIDRVILSRATTFSDSLLETLGSIRAQAGQHVLTQISEQSRTRLFESMTEALLAFAHEVDRTPAQSWTENEMLMSSIDLLSPWVPCIRGLSFDHSPVMNTIIKHIGTSLFS